MSQTEYNYYSPTATTSTGTVVIRTGPGLLQAITVNSSGTGSVTFYDSTATSSGNEIAVLGPGALGSPETLWYNIALKNGLTRGQTTSTADYTVTWA